MATYSARPGSQGLGINFAALGDFSNLTSKGKDHLRNVSTRPHDHASPSPARSSRCLCSYICQRGGQTYVCVY